MKKQLLIVCTLLISVFLFQKCKQDDFAHPYPYEGIIDTSEYILKYSIRFSKRPTINNFKLYKKRVSLGNALYHDPILSNNGLSCSSCHDQHIAFTNESQNSESHVNLAWNTNFLRTGIVLGGGIKAAMRFEVNDFFKTDINKLRQSFKYQKLFYEAYGAYSINEDQLIDALAQYTSTLVSYQSRFDLYMDKKGTLTNEEQRGMTSFFSEAGDCYHCHSLPLLTDNQFHNIGLEDTFLGENKGLHNNTGQAYDVGQFKTPSLRNIELTAPYMHDGRYKTLEEVVDFYVSGVHGSPTLDPMMTKRGLDLALPLNTQDKKDLVAFLKTLTDTAYLNNLTFGASK
ncbi:MAG: c-type cytochrome [Bacteroidia bacterium]|nr:c-type cytochrome [Bacteroidia bacterium]